MRSKSKFLAFAMATAFASPALSAEISNADPRDIMSMGAEAPDWFERKLIRVPLIGYFDDEQFVFMYSFTAQQVHVLFINAMISEVDQKSAQFLKSTCRPSNAADSRACNVKVILKLERCTHTGGPLRLAEVKNEADLPRATVTTRCTGSSFRLDPIPR